MTADMANLPGEPVICCGFQDPEEYDVWDGIGLRRQSCGYEFDGEEAQVWGDREAANRGSMSAVDEVVAGDLHGRTERQLRQDTARITAEVDRMLREDEALVEGNR